MRPVDLTRRRNDLTQFRLVMGDSLSHLLLVVMAVIDCRHTRYCTGDMIQ